MKFQFATILGVVLVSALILASGMYVYTSAQSTISNTMADMNEQEIQAFNSNFTVYEGNQTGSMTKAFLQRLIATAKTYCDEPDKIPRVRYVTSEDDNSDAKDWQESDEGGKITSSVLESNSAGQKEYTNALQKLLDAMEPKHTYFIELNTDDTGLIDEIVIYYDKDEE